MSDTDDQPVIQVEHVVKRFGDVTAVDDVSLSIAQGEFFSLLGPSGCGKTTTLRMLAGFETPSEGRILLEGEDVTGVPPDHRDVNMVFQNYALFPHLSVADNVAYGLKRDGVSGDELHDRVGDVLELVQMPRDGFGDRRPQQLSGGQQQRVALARALVKRPRALLLDEPLGALDLKLRRGMQLELKSMQDELGITFVYVTHDQEEALTMSDRIAVMDGGRVVQVGSPREIYRRPRTRFVADFIGVSNIVELPVEQRNDDVTTLVAPGEHDRVVLTTTPDVGSDHATFCVRPEDMQVRDSGVRAEDGCVVAGRVRTSAYLGSEVQYQVDVPSLGTLLATAPNSSDERAPGDEVALVWPADAGVPLGDHDLDHDTGTGDEDEMTPTAAGPP